MPLAKNLIPILVLAATAVATATPAIAYIGPGAGLSALGSILAFLGVVLLVIAGFVWYPVKRLLAKLRAARDPATKTDESK